MKFLMCQDLRVFSDGSVVLSYNVNSKPSKSIKSSTKDLKSFQKLAKLNSSKLLIDLNGTGLTHSFRKKLFK